MPGRRLQFAVRRFLDVNNGKVIPWNQWGPGYERYVDNTFPPILEPTVLGGPGFNVSWQMFDYAAADCIGQLDALSNPPTVTWDATSAKDWGSDSSGRYGFNSVSRLLTLKDGSTRIEVIPGAKGTCFATQNAPFRGGWVIFQPSATGADQLCAFHVQQILHNMTLAGHPAPTIFNLELEGLISEGQNWWGKASWAAREADLTEGRSRISAFLRDIRLRADDASWHPQPQLSEIRIWIAYWASVNGPAILKMLFDAVTDANMTPKFYSYVNLAQKYAYAQANWEAERVMRAAFPPGTMVPCVWMWDRQRNTTEAGEPLSRFWTWQIEAAFETALAWYPDASTIVMDCPGAEFSNAVRAVATYLNRVRAL